MVLAILFSSFTTVVTPLQKSGVVDYSTDTAEISLYVDSITALIATKDLKTLQHFVHPTHGMFILYRLGMFEQFVKRDSFPDVFIYEDYYPYVDSSVAMNHFKIVDSKELPHFTCDSDGMWLSKGAYAAVNTQPDVFDYVFGNLRIQGILSEIQIRQMEESVQFFQINGVQVIHTEVGHDGLVYWIYRESGKYYIGLVDMVKTDCGV